MPLAALTALLLSLALGVPGGPMAGLPGVEGGAVWLPTAQAEAIPVAETAEHIPATETHLENQATPTSAGEATLWYFWREGCPFCDQAEPWVEALDRRFEGLTVEKVGVTRDPMAQAVFGRMMEERGQRASAVPTFILEEEVWVGFSASLAADIENAVAARLGVEDRRDDAGASVLDLGPLGQINVAQQPMVAATALIAFVDGFNPCSLWVLGVLLAMIMGTGSRRRIAAVGLTFLLVTASIYGAFIAGVFAAMAVLERLAWIQVAVAILALGFGLVNVKDFLAWKRGPSLTIPDRFKPRIYRGGRKIREERSLPATLAITVALAAGVAMVELPCTAGFPVIWTSLVTEAGIHGTGFLSLLLLYVGVYLSVEIAILIGAVVTLKATRLQERQGRVLKLFGGMLMIALAGVLLVDPSLMETLTGSLAVVAGATVLSLLALLLDRRLGRDA